jgi:chemosensory pili system protein ChpB (putative protein-glutamate methylesterase)
VGAVDPVVDHRVRVGILGTSLLGRADLRRGLESCGLEVVVEEPLTSFLSDVAHQGEVDVILVDLEQAEDDDLDILDALVEYNPVPMVFHDVSGRADNAAWLRRLADKLSRAAAKPVRAAPAPAPGRAPPRPTGRGPVVKSLRCWVLGASFGGPEALKRFLTAVPEVPANICFIIGQHIGDGFVEVLASQLNRATPFKVAPAVDGAVLESGHIYVAPVRERLRISAGGELKLEPERERHTYMPSIDTLMQEVAERFGASSGAIIFSGMGDDGAKGCKFIAEAGGVVWAQDSASCAIDSMPSRAVATGLVSHRDAPEQLAVAMVEFLRQQRAPLAGGA